MGPSCGSFWCVAGPPRALLGVMFGVFGALVAFGVRVLHDVVDFRVIGAK